MMKKESGDKNFPIWLLGDSNPPQWEKELQVPLDSRHPIRHNIWTSVIDVVQDRVFRELGKRIETENIFIRNAVENVAHKPKANEVVWNPKVSQEVDDFGVDIQKYRPRIIFSFGAYAFEFARRANHELPNNQFGHWGAKELGNEFKQRMDVFDASKTNIIPLLHRSISGGKYLESHNQFCFWQANPNYFQIVGNRIADVLVLN